MVCRQNRQFQAGLSSSEVAERGSTIPAFLRQGPYKNYEHCIVMKISLEIDALHWIAIAASKDHLQLVLEIKREESEFSPAAICL